MQKPNKFPGPFAEFGDYTVIPERQPQPGGGEANYREGFPVETSFLLTENGKPVSRMDMNGILNAITTALVYQQAGGMYDWDATVDYDPPAIVWSAGTQNFYVCLKANGPSSTVMNPVNDTNENYWRYIGGGKQLQAALDNKANKNHTHTASQITGLSNSYVSKSDLTVGAKTFSASARRGLYEFTTAVSRDSYGRLTGITMTNSNCTDTDTDVDTDTDSDNDSDTDGGY